jgi:hypothetical protein
MTRQQFLRTLSAGAIGFFVRRAQAQPAAPQTFTYKTAECKIRADVYGATEGAAKPALMRMHGGALIVHPHAPVARVSLVIMPTPTTAPNASHQRFPHTLLLAAGLD